MLTIKKLHDQIQAMSTQVYEYVQHAARLNDQHAYQLWKKTAFNFVVIKSALLDYTTKYWNDLPENTPLSYAFWILAQKLKSMRTPFGQLPFNREITFEEQGISLLLRMLKKEYSDFTFIKNPLTSQRTILYAGNLHCTEIHAMLTKQDTGFELLAQAIHPQGLTKQHIMNFFNTVAKYFRIKQEDYPQAQIFTASEIQKLLGKNKNKKE